MEQSKQPPLLIVSPSCSWPEPMSHAACPQEGIDHALLERVIYCTCGCHVDRQLEPSPWRIMETEEGLMGKLSGAISLLEKAAANPEIIGQMQEARNGGFINNVLKLRAALIKAGAGGFNDYEQLHQSVTEILKRR